MRTRYCFNLLPWVMLLILLTYAPTIHAEDEEVAPSEAEVIFSVDVKKPIDTVNITGENDEFVLLTNKARVFVYNANTGEMLWETQVDDFVEGALEVIWNNTKFITSRKKGMICYDIASGEVVWQTTTTLKMKNYLDYYLFDDLFVIEMSDNFMAVDPENGSILWTSEKPAAESKLREAGIQTIYYYNGEYGSRILQLGKKQTTLLDAKTGVPMATAALKWTPKNDTPVTEIGDDAIGLFYKKGTMSLSLIDGKVLWVVEEEVDPKRGYLVFDVEDHPYGIFSFKKSAALMDLANGEKKWETSEEVAFKISQIRVLPDGTMLLFGKKNLAFKSKEKPNRGIHNWVYAFDFATGDIKWGPTFLTLSKPGSHNWVHDIYERPDGLLLYIYGDRTFKVTQADTTEWTEEGGEGFALLDQNTGELKWQNYFSMREHWEKGLKGATIFAEYFGDARNYGQVQKGYPNWNDVAPEPIFDGDFALVQGNGGWLKVDLTNGEILWQIPDIPYSSNVYYDQGKLFGSMGLSLWSYLATSDLKAEDLFNQTKKPGHFIIDTEVGELIYKTEKLKTPYNLYYEHYDPDTQMLYMCDGQYFRKLNLNTGMFEWEIRLKKQVTGDISAEEGVAFVLVGYSVSHSTTSYGWRTVTEKTYDHSMEHGIMLLENGNFLVRASEGIAVINPAGEIVWTTEWKWDPKKIEFTPKVTKNGILYQYKKDLVYYSLEDGSIIWKTKASKEADYMFFPDLSKVLVTEKKKMIAYKI